MQVVTCRRGSGSRRSTWRIRRRCGRSPVPAAKCCPCCRWCSRAPRRCRRRPPRPTRPTTRRECEDRRGLTGPPQGRAELESMFATLPDHEPSPCGSIHVATSGLPVSPDASVTGDWRSSRGTAPSVPSKSGQAGGEPTRTCSRPSMSSEDGVAAELDVEGPPRSGSSPSSVPWGASPAGPGGQVRRREGKQARSGTPPSSPVGPDATITSAPSVSGARRDAGGTPRRATRPRPTRGRAPRARSKRVASCGA